tara:strand:- start:86 stop:262 length:177 start_codon:yes stop_codon:yes gene_type:complete
MTDREYIDRLKQKLLEAKRNADPTAYPYMNGWGLNFWAGQVDQLENKIERLESQMEDK